MLRCTDIVSRTSAGGCCIRAGGVMKGGGRGNSIVKIKMQLALFIIILNETALLSLSFMFFLAHYHSMCNYPITFHFR